MATVMQTGVEYRVSQVQLATFLYMYFISLTGSDEGQFSRILTLDCTDHDRPGNTVFERRFTVSEVHANSERITLEGYIGPSPMTVGRTRASLAF